MKLTCSRCGFTGYGVIAMWAHVWKGAMQMTRCYFCHRRIWPWQSIGWRGNERWHGRCWR